MKRLIIAILAFLLGPKSRFHQDRPKGAYRTPGEIEEIPELPKPVKEESKTARRLRLWRERLSSMSYDGFLENVWKTFWGLGVVAVICGALYMVGSALFSKGNVDYCYVERWTYVKETNSGVVKPPPDPGSITNKEDPKNQIPGKEQTVVIVYELKGHRNWRSDRDIGRYDSLPDAVEASHKINCAVEAK